MMNTMVEDYSDSEGETQAPLDTARAEGVKKSRYDFETEAEYKSYIAKRAAADEGDGGRKKKRSKKAMASAEEQKEKQQLDNDMQKIDAILRKQGKKGFMPKPAPSAAEDPLDD